VYAPYQLLGNSAGVKYPYKVVKQFVQRSFIIEVPGCGEKLQGSF